MAKPKKSKRFHYSLETLLKVRSIREKQEQDKFNEACRVLEEEMKKEKLPTYLEKQKLLYLKETPAEVLINIGNQLFEQGCYMDALDFYHKSHNTEGLQNIRQVATEQGDFFLFQK